MTTMAARTDRKPPATVFAGSYLFAGVAALALVGAIGALFAIPELGHYESDRARDDAAGELAAVGLVLYAAMAVVFSFLCLLLAILGGRGRPAARVLTWVLGGLTVCFNIGLLVIGPYDSVLWYRVLTQMAAWAAILLATGSAVLLALPTSHGYFRAMRAARQQQRLLHFGPPSDYRPPSHPMPPPGYQPPPSFGQPMPPPGYQPPCSPAPPHGVAPSSTWPASASQVDPALPSAGGNTSDPPPDSR